MPKKLSVQLLLFDISTALEKIETFCSGISFEQLMADERTKYAVLWNIQIIGEASKNLPASYISSHPGVDWRGLAGIRDIITHRYFRVDWKLIWKSITDELPVLKLQIQRLLKEDNN